MAFRMSFDNQQRVLLLIHSLKTAFIRRIYCFLLVFRGDSAQKVVGVFGDSGDVGRFGDGAVERDGFMRNLL